MASDPNNIFAKILRGEIPCVKLFEDDKTLAFMDVMPEADGHVLVVPKEPAETLDQLSKSLASASARQREPKPPSLWQLARRATSQDSRRGLSLLTHLLSALGRSLRRGPS